MKPAQAKRAPGDAEALRLLGLAAARSGRLDEAAEHYAAALDGGRDEPRALNEYASILAALGRTEDAVAVYRKLTANGAASAGSFRGLGNALRRLGRLDEAVGAFETARDLDPESAPSHVDLGNVLSELGDARAAAAYAEALARAPDSAAAHNGVGNLLMTQGRLDEAIEAFRRAVACQPDFAFAHYNLANALRAAGDGDRAVAHLRQAVALKPDFAEAHNNLGNALKDLDRLDEARAAYRGALAARPDYAEARSNLGGLLKQEGDLEAATRAYRRAVTSRPDFAEAWNNLGNILALRRKTDAAADCYRRVLDMEPTHPSAAHMLAAMTGATTARAPDGYVRDLFDNYASTFDSHLVKALAYRMPSLLREEIDALGAARFERVMDLGCGTGLGAEAFRDIAGHLHGVDLAPKMIAEARRKEIYEHLEVGEALACLSESPGDYDLVLSADVFVYIGDLEPIFAAVRDKTVLGALFAFSVEAADGDGFALLDCGRYAHSSRYIEGLAANYGFSIERRRHVPIREERGGPVAGYLFVLKVAARETP